MSEQRQTYKGYTIGYQPPAVQAREWDWWFEHEDYDGTPDAYDSRSGYGPSAEACRAQIDDQIEDEQ